jgi:hypothetical protein
MDCEWRLSAWLDVVQLPVPDDVPKSQHNNYREQLEDYIERCAMVLEDWDKRDAQWLGEFRWGWVDYDRQLAWIALEVQGFSDLRLFVWLNDFAFAGLQTIYVLAVNHNGGNYLQEDGMQTLLLRRDDLIGQLTHGET